MEKLTESQHHHLVMIRAGSVSSLNKTVLLNLYQKGLITYRLRGKYVVYADLTDRGKEVLDK